jgi:hypothetical protein
MPYTDKLDPSRAWYLRLRDEAKCTKSRTEIADPIRERPYMDKLEPHRAKPRTDTADANVV